MPVIDSINALNNIAPGAVSDALDKKNKVADTDSFEKSLNDALSKNDDKQLKDLCKEFEGILLNMMYKEMKNTVAVSDLIPKEPGREIFESMLDDELMNNAANAESLGLADVLFNQLKMQAVSAYKENSLGK